MNLDNVIIRQPHKLICRDGDKCIKVFDETFSKADILNEALNQARVEETGLAIPRIHEVTKVDGKWAIVLDYIEGKTLAQRMSEEPERRDEFLERMVDLQLLVCSKTCPKLNRLKDKMNTKIDQTDLDATAKYDLHVRLEGMPTHKKVCHGDFNPSNIIITEDDQAFILDWSHATQGNASADAARTYLLFWLAGDVVTAKKYLQLFCQKSDTARQYVEKWMPIVAASQSTKGNAHERELLLSWVSVVEYV